MDKIREVDNTFNHSIQISERKNCLITGVKKLENFNETEFLIETNMGFILLKGESLELLKLDTFQGMVSIKGKIDQISYLEENSKKVKTENIMAKLFK